MEYLTNRKNETNSRRNLTVAARDYKISVPRAHTFRHAFSPVQTKKNAQNSIKNLRQESDNAHNSKEYFKKNIQLQAQKNSSSRNSLMGTAFAKKQNATNNTKKSKIYLDRVISEMNQQKSSGATNLSQKKAVSRQNISKNPAEKIQHAQKFSDAAIKNDNTIQKKMVKPLNKSFVQPRSHPKQNLSTNSVQSSVFPQNKQVLIDNSQKNSLSEKAKKVLPGDHLKQSKLANNLSLDAAAKTADSIARSPFDPLPVTSEVKTKKQIKKKTKYFAKFSKNIRKKIKNLNKKNTQQEKKTEKMMSDATRYLSNNFLNEPEPALNPAIADSDFGGGKMDFASRIIASENRENSYDNSVCDVKKTEQHKSQAKNQNVEISGAGAAAIEKVSSANLLSKIANQKVTFTFKVNTDKLFAFVRILAILLIIAVSGYLAWDTWMTNRAVNDTFSQSDSSASAMSIAAANPATADATSVSKQSYSEYTVPADQPRYIKIPSIGVNARVMTVGVTSNGNIDAPQNLNDTAWYDGSAKPGQEGQVFIDGHTSFASHLAAAFNALPQLKKGAKITIELGSGEKVNYTVTKTESAKANQINMSQVLSTQGNSKKGLSLMTCTGTFNYRTQTSDERFLVYAEQDD